MSRRSREFYRQLWGRKLDAAIPGEERSLQEMAALAWLDESHQSGVLLDVGCGTGGLLAAVVDGVGKKFGLELEARAAARAAEHSNGVAVANLDDHGLPFLAASFDVVTCLDVIEHVFDPRYLLEELRRVLRPGGALLLSTPNFRYWKHLRSCARGRFPRTSTDELGYDGGHLHYFMSANLVELLQAVGTWRIERRGIFGAISFRHRIARRVIGSTLDRELLAPGLLVKATKLAEPSSTS